VPIYEYECTKCGHRFERIQKFSDPRVSTCPKCKGRVQQLLHAPAVQFKGSGWYVTDYARKGTSGSGDGSDPTKSEQKSDTKSETKETKKEVKPKTESSKSRESE